MSFRAVLSGTALFGLGVQAFWRMECPHRIGLARMDPIVNLGAASPHAHAIYGSNGFSLDSGFDQLTAGGCTSCRAHEDKSAYWHPQLYFHDDATGQYEEVEPLGGMLAYYFLHGQDIQPFPPGFKMLAGDNRRRDFTAPWDPHGPDPEKSHWRSAGYVKQDILKQLAVGVNCLNYASGKNEPTLMRHYLPDKDFIDTHCPDGIRFELMFPSCWVGGDVLDTPNHVDHVAYPDTVIDGSCPEGFPVRLPGLMFESFYNTVAFKDRRGTYVLSNGDTEGYGYHGDFISGWDQEVLRRAINTCTNKSGRIEDCPVFTLQSKSDASTCNMEVPGLLAAEDAYGPIPLLPGGLKLGDLVGQITDSLLGDGIHAAANEPAAPAPEPEPEPVTTAKPLTFAPEPSNVVSTQYIRDGDVMSKIYWVEEVVWVTESPDGATVVAATPSPVAKRHLHRRVHARH